MTDRTAEQLASDFTAMGHSIAIITDVIAGDSMAEDDAADRHHLLPEHYLRLRL